MSGAKLDAEVTLGPSADLMDKPEGPHHFRAVVHGIK